MAVSSDPTACSTGELPGLTTYPGQGGTFERASDVPTASSIDSTVSPTDVRRSTRTPISASLRARYAPLVSIVNPRRSSSPIVTINLWFDRMVMPADDLPFVGLPGRDMQWVFDKRQVFGGEASHLSLVSSGASPLVAKTNAELVAADGLDEISVSDSTRVVEVKDGGTEEWYMSPEELGFDRVGIEQIAGGSPCRCRN